MTNSLTIGVLSSSTRTVGIGRHVADWVAAQAPAGTQTRMLDLRELNLPLLDEPKMPAMGDYELESTREWSQLVQSVDALVIVTPEYNGGYPASLKNALDSLYAEWEGKPVAAVGYGFGGGARAVDALNLILANLKMQVQEAPGLTFDEHLTPAGEITNDAPAEAVAAVLESLARAAASRSATVDA